MPRTITREEFDRACDAIWTEFVYADGNAIRTSDEAKDVPGFCTLLRVYLSKMENDWATKPGVNQGDGSVQVTQALNGLRKVAAIAMRGMIYNGVRGREN